MSGKVSGWVWDQPLPQNEKFVLLAYADHADHNGYNIFPSIDLMVHKTGYSHRSIQRITKRLVEKNYLVAVGSGPNGVNKYRIPMYGGDKMTPPISGDDIAVAEGGDMAMARGGDTATSPKPSVNRQEPSVKRDSSDFQKEWVVFLLAWAKHFPHKVQPRVNNKTLKAKLKIRLKDIYFKENYETALMQASGSDFINTSSWMQADWFLKNEENWEKCLDGKYDSNIIPAHSTQQATKNGLLKYLKDEGVIVD
jgi:hypothetical protein